MKRLEIMARFSVGDDEMRGRKRKQRNRGTTEIDSNPKKLRRDGEGEVNDEDVEEGQEDREEEGGGDQEDADDLEEEEAREEDGESRGSGGENSSSGVAVRIDTDVLDCSICFEPLRPPLFQCRNGHVACSSCCAKLLNKCHICYDTTGYSRCLILEKVIESIKIPCSNAEYGCKRTFSYSQKHAHEMTCIHAPCFCPMNNCSFCGSTRMLSAHFSRNHHHSAKTFWYDRPFKVSFEQTEPFLVLYGEDSHLFLLFNSNGKPSGYALSMACIRPSALEWDFSYELTASSEGSSLQVRASTTNIQNSMPDDPAKVFLMVPINFFSGGKIFLDVCIRKTKSSCVN